MRNHQIISYVALLFLLTLAPVSHAQKWKDALQKAKEKIGEKAEKITTGLVATGKELIEARKAAMDTATYNYAVSLSDNASFYSSNNQASQFALNATSIMPNLDAERFEQSMDMNRQGEQLYQLRRFRLAGFNYFSSLLLYSDNVDKDFDPKELKSTKKDWQEKLLKTMLATEADTVGFAQEDYFAYSRTLDNIGQLLHQKGRYIMAEKASLKALAIRKASLPAGHPATAASYNNVGVLFQDMGKFTEAEEHLKKAVEGHLAHFGKESIPYALSLNNQAMLYQSIGRYEEAKEQLKTCIAIMKKEGQDKTQELAPFQVNLALIHQDLKEYTEAKAIYEQLLDYYQNRLQLGNSVQEAYVLNHAASLYLAMGDSETAGNHLKKALKIYYSKYGKSSAPYATILHHMSLYHAYIKQWSEAKATGMEAMAIRKKLLAVHHPDILESLEDLAVVHWEMQDYQMADSLFTESLTLQQEQVKKVFPAMNEYEKGRFWSKTRPSMMLFYNYALDRKQASPVLLQQAFDMHVKTKGLLLSATSKVKDQILSGSDEALKKRYTDWLDQKEQLALYYTFSNEDLKEDGINLDSLEKMANENEKMLAKIATGFSDAYTLPQATSKAIRGQLSNTAAAVEIIRIPLFKDGQWVVDESRYAALIVTKEQKYPAVVVLEDGKTLESKYAKFYRAAVTKQIKDTYSYEQFWRPIADALGEKSEVFLSVDGVYNQININTLLTDDEQYVLDMMDIRLLSSTRQLLYANTEKKGIKKDALLIGFPYYGTKGTISPLPGTADEIAGVSKVLQQYDHHVKTLLQRDASETLLKSNLNGRSLLHIATHGFFLEDAVADNSGKVFGVDLEKAKENPMLRAGLMFFNAESAIDSERKEVKSTDNGILTAFEVTTLPLEHIELVVLSACETGLGEVKAGEGVYGLQRAFQVAGAEALMMSLWKVSDEATARLLQLFYQNWMQTGNKELSFSKAQRQLKQDYPNPYFWGAFVLLQ